jgi:transposase
MAETSCPGCRERDALTAALLERVAALEARVRQLEGQPPPNATNSSVPPSANPPGAPKPVVKKPTGKKPGGQPGHEGHLRLRLPPERVNHLIPLVPDRCGRCRAPLPAQPGPQDPEPSWHQVAELPRVAAVVTEFQGHARTCGCCGHLTRAAIPGELRAHAVGPRLAAVLSYLQGCQHVSQRGLGEVVEAVFGVPVSLGTVAALGQQMGQALAAAHQEVADEVRRAKAKNVDETGWKQAGTRRWLWAAVTSTAAFFLVQARRGAKALKALLGEAVVGLVCSDRWSAYQSVPLSQRQVCWAHLRRDFQAMIDRGGEGAAVGEDLLAYSVMVFAWWRRVRDGTMSRQTLRQHVAELRPWVRARLRAGAACGCAKTAGVCANVLEVEPALWTFAAHEGVEPTNNAAERALRPAVLWRKGSFGCHSEQGCRLVERLLSVVQTLRLQKRPVLGYLVEALVAHRYGLSAPKLFQTG